MRQRRRNDQKSKKQGSKDTGTTAQIETAVDFIDRMNGTLPEALTARDLKALNAALSFFFADLRWAWALFQASERHGRAGPFLALGAMWKFIALFKQPFAENLHLPILLLQDALTALDHNKVAPMLKPVLRRGRTRSTGARLALRGYAAGTVERLKQTGLTKPQAYARVAKTLTKLDIRAERGRRQITADTIRHWCDEVSADVSRTREAAIVYDGMFTDDERRRFSDLRSNHARRSRAIASLTHWIWAVFPETRKTS
jgi:hypothetical protein